MNHIIFVSMLIVACSYGSKVTDENKIKPYHKMGGRKLFVSNKKANVAGCPAICNGQDAEFAAFNNDEDFMMVEEIQLNEPVWIDFRQESKGEFTTFNGFKRYLSGRSLEFVVNMQTLYSDINETNQKTKYFMLMPGPQLNKTSSPSNILSCLCIKIESDFLNRFVFAGKKYIITANRVDHDTIDTLCSNYGSRGAIFEADDDSLFFVLNFMEIPPNVKIWTSIKTNPDEPESFDLYCGEIEKKICTEKLAKMKRDMTECDHCYCVVMESEQIGSTNKTLSRVPCNTGSYHAFCRHDLNSRN